MKFNAVYGNTGYVNGFFPNFVSALLVCFTYKGDSQVNQKRKDDIYSISLNEIQRCVRKYWICQRFFPQFCVRFVSLLHIKSAFSSEINKIGLHIHYLIE